MRKKIIHKIFYFSVFFILYNCYSVPEIHYINSADEEKSNVKNKLMIQLYNNDIYNRKISIKTDENEVIFQGSVINTSIHTRTSGNSQVLDFILHDNTKGFDVKYNAKKYKLNIDNRYNIIFIDIRNNTIEAVYTNREPVFTD